MHTVTIAPYTVYVSLIHTLIGVSLEIKVCPEHCNYTHVYSDTELYQAHSQATWSGNGVVCHTHTWVSASCGHW